MKDENKQFETTQKPAPAYKPYQVPYNLYEKLERRATIIRKETGLEVRWTDVLKNILEENLSSSDTT